MYRSPEVDMLDVSKGKVVVNWSLGCDIWALGSLVSVAALFFCSFRFIRLVLQLTLLFHGRSCTTL